MKKIVCIVGTNASGKSSLSLELAKTFNAEIISADSRQIYRGYDLCSGKVSKEERLEINHHLIDLLDIGAFFSVSDFQRLAYSKIDYLHSINKNVFIVGGTGLYINSIIDGYELLEVKPDFHLRNELESKSNEELISIIEKKEGIIPKYIDKKNKTRLLRATEVVLSGRSLDSTRKAIPKYEILLLGVTWERDILKNRINERLKTRLDEGMIEEIKKGIVAEGIPYEVFYKLGLEYRLIAQFLNNEFKNFDDFFEKLKIAIHQFSKRQMTWFKKNSSITWLNMQADYITEAKNLITNFYSGRP